MIIIIVLVVIETIIERPERGVETSYAKYWGLIFLLVEKKNKKEKRKKEFLWNWKRLDS